MEENNKKLLFGKKYRVGNFWVMKFNRTLRKSEVAELRDMIGIPSDIRKSLQRSQLPYIKVSAISGIWSVEFCCNNVMFRFIDELLAKAVEAEENGVVLEGSSVADFAHMFNMFYTDTCVLGDSIYMADKANALKAFMSRQQAVEISEEEDRRILDDMKADEEAKATILDMASHIGEGGES